MIAGTKDPQVVSVLLQNAVPVKDGIRNEAVRVDVLCLVRFESADGLSIHYVEHQFHERVGGGWRKALTVSNPLTPALQALIVSGVVTELVNHLAASRIVPADPSLIQLLEVPKAPQDEQGQPVAIQGAESGDV